MYPFTYLQSNDRIKSFARRNWQGGTSWLAKNYVIANLHTVAHVQQQFAKLFYGAHAQQ